MDRLSDYDYDLPESLIAQTPLEDRAASRLLVLDPKTGEVHHHSFRDVPELLRPGDLLVMNDTRVSAVRVKGHKPTGGEVEALLLSEPSPGRFEALLKPGKRLRPGAEILFEGSLRASVGEDLGDGLKTLEFEAGAEAGRRLRETGAVPLPPYIHEALADRERYQTVYAANEGSAAAPTAGLHFTEEILSQLRLRGVGTARVTLDVGIDTFRPVQSENLDEHRMHGERFHIPQETADRIASCEGRVLAVGTTTVRTLETAATGPRRVQPGSGESRLFVRPGYRFQVVDGMFTNFHLPRTTMMMMISALASRDFVMAAYREAVTKNYRFLSFGDSMLILSS